MFRTLFGFGRKNRSSQRRGAAPGAVRRRYSPLRLEELEPRETPTVDAFVFGTQLNVNCFNDAVNTVKVDHGSTPDRALISWSDSAGLSGSSSFNDTTYTNIVIWGGNLGTTSDILANVKPVSVFNRLEGDVVNVGGDGSAGTANKVQKIQAELAIANTGVHSVVNVHDENDATVRTARLRHYWLGGIIDDAHEVHGVDGLGSFYLYFNRSVTRALNIHTGLGRADLTVESTAALPLSGAITLFGNHNSSTDSLNDTVTVGKDGSVQNVKGILTIENEPDFTAITIDDHLDNTRRTVTLDTYVAGTDTFGKITGLSSGQTINFECIDTNSVAIETGKGGADVNVWRTCALGGTGLITLAGNHSGGIDGLNDTVSVGKAGSVQEISGALMITNPLFFTDLYVDDSADAAFQSPILDTMGGVGRIRNLAATISYLCSDVNSLTIWTGVGGAHVEVQDTCVPTTLFGLSGVGNDVVCVEGTHAPLTINVSPNELVQLGNAPTNRLNGITVPVTINGDGTTTLNVVDQGSPFAGDTYTVLPGSLGTTELGLVANYNGLATLNLWRTFAVGSNRFVPLLLPFTLVDQTGINPPPVC
jgi:hypothetical protein